MESELYHPITCPPPTNSNIRVRKTSRECMRNNRDTLTHLKSQPSQGKANAIASSKNKTEPFVCCKGQNNLSVRLSKDTEKALSASNLYALHNPNLSLQYALSKKAYDQPNTSFAREKAMFTAWVQKYYHQLTVGCLNDECKNKFCYSSSTRLNIKPAMAALLSVELSGYKDRYLCVKDEHKQKATVLSTEIFNVSNKKVENNNVDQAACASPFLYSFYSTSPFRSLFLPCPLISSGLGMRRRHSLTTICNEKPHGSESSLTGTLKKHINLIANTISSSLSNIWKACEDESTKNIPTANAAGETDHEVILTRARLPSVRIFGDDNAIDKQAGDFHDLDLFEASVAEEFQRSTVANEMCFCKGEVNEGYSLTHLTLEMFDSVLSNYYECMDMSFLLNTLRTVFSSWESLSISFCDESLRASQMKGFAFNIKLEDVVAMFERLKKIENSKVLFTLLIDSVKVMLLSKKEYSMKPSELKPLVIILEIPNLFDDQPVIQEVVTMITELPKESKNALAFYMSSFPREKFEYIVQGFQSILISEMLMATPQNKMKLRNLCETLQLLYAANGVEGEHRLVVPYSLFYCEEFTANVDFKLEYSSWSIRRHKKSRNIFSILDYPFLLEPSVKVQVIHIDAITQMREEYQNAIVHQARVQQVQKSWSDFNDSSTLSQGVRSAMCPYLLLEIRRQHIINDTLKQLQNKTSDYKKPLKIKYTDGGEQGLDMGGLQKEFFQVIIETMFDPNYCLFTLSEDGNLVWFNAYSLESVVMFRLVGILLGLAIYNGIILDVHFPLLVYKKLLGYRVAFEDLQEIQPMLCRGLAQILSYEGDVEHDFGVMFETSQNLYGRDVKTELLPNGSQIPVTNDNRQEFVHLYIDMILNSNIEKQFEAFRQGFFEVCHGPTINLFTPPQLELLICGSPELDFNALERVTEYKDGFSKRHPLMLEFWEIVHRFTFKQKQALLMFVTGSYRVPLKGLGSMSFYIQRNGPDSSNLPTSMTCFNRLLIPEYSTREKLERMLLLAIENAKGFGLT